VTTHPARRTHPRTGDEKDGDEKENDGKEKDGNEAETNTSGREYRGGVGLCSR
jgi:hypothetical protein